MVSEMYKVELTSAMLQAWWGSLKAYDVDVVEQALFSYIACPDSGMFEPKPANLIKFITGTTKSNAQVVDDRAEIAWACVEGEIRRIGSYGTLKLDDGAAMAAVASIGGWKDLCYCSTEQLTWKKKEFCSAYSTLERTPLESLPESLPGRIELSEKRRAENKVLQKILTGAKEHAKNNPVPPENIVKPKGVLSDGAKERGLKEVEKLKLMFGNAEKGSEDKRN